ncbi:hypothetical protein DFR58_11976 [Anaerobacterium chartisolvens]|uniref:Immunity MXAN-0049 protein domain-containing protein n=1 Tax=Anaerobacterium chartisolvens TaxID=1297424 RepID=A0A369AUL2_9FIRM|nr:DUF1629 domain-containing protein [Anaerobacterium chartisolvens]RCX13019.1 hypothetical protein DFR58_11976 [Anaerobacterium chartisolvens]
MKIWLLDCDVDNYDNLTWKNDIDIDEVQTFDGRQKLMNWNPVQVKRMYDREFSNSPGLSSHIPIFDKKAVDTLKDLLIGNAEILQLDCEGWEFYAINVIKVLDCIDYDKSEYKTFRDGKRIMRFIKYAFDISKVKNEHLFKIVDEPLRRPFVSDEFRNRILENNLTGFKFELVWDSDKN